MRVRGLRHESQHFTALMRYASLCQPNALFKITIINMHKKAGDQTGFDCDFMA
jgi:hypothetical protein